MAHQDGGLGIFYLYNLQPAIDIAKRSCVAQILNLVSRSWVFVSTRRLSKVFVQLGDSVMIRKALPFVQWLCFAWQPIHDRVIYFTPQIGLAYRA
jgi:hypothetical protein